MCLLHMKEGDYVAVDSLNVSDELKFRLASFGVCRECTVCIKRFGLFKSTVQIQVNNTLIALRKEEAKSIEVHKVA